MGFYEQVQRWRRRQRRIDAAERQLIGVDPFGPTPPGFHFDVAVSLRADVTHRHYGVYTHITGTNWPDINFTSWYDCAVCGHVSGVE